MAFDQDHCRLLRSKIENVIPKSHLKDLNGFTDWQSEGYLWLVTGHNSVWSQLTS